MLSYPIELRKVLDNDTGLLSPIAHIGVTSKMLKYVHNFGCTAPMSIPNAAYTI